MSPKTTFFNAVCWAHLLTRFLLILATDLIISVILFLLLPAFQLESA